MSTCDRGHIIADGGTCDVCKSRHEAITNRQHIWAGGGPNLLNNDLPPSVNLAALLDDVRAFVRCYVVLSDAQVAAVTLWTAHTHAFQAAEATPYLSVSSPEKRSGKTRLLEVLSLVVARPWLTGRVTAAVLVRKIASQTATLLLDESDGAFKAEKEYAEALRAVLNAGHRRGGCASLCVKKGADFELVDFPVFGPKAIAGIGKLPDTIADRAVPIAMKRRAPGERVSRFKYREAREQAESLRDGLTAWAGDSVDALRDARPDIPPELDDRSADGWEPLLAIADAAGGDWPGRARAVALALSVGDAREDDSLGVRLLGDVRGVFDGQASDRIVSGELVEALVGMEEAPWGDIKGKAMDARRLARFLRPYGVRPRTIRLDDGATAKGYHAEWFADAWARYLPRPSPKSPSQASQASQTPDTDTGDVTDVTDVTANSGILVQPQEDGQKVYILSLAEVLGWPAVHLGEREINGRTVSVGVPAGKFAWEQAIRFWPDDLLGELVVALEGMGK